MFSSFLPWCVLGFVLLLTACASDQQATTPTAAPATTTPLPAPVGTPMPTSLPPGTFLNPVLDQDFPDPDVLHVGDNYYAYATNHDAVHIQVAKSTDLVHWQVGGDVLPRLPTWAQQTVGLTWAPDVSSYDNDSRFVMYFVSRDAASASQCIGVATSSTPEGPFTPVDGAPLICQADQGGSIDPASFVDADGTHYILWKNDGNCCGKPTFLYIQKVSADGLTLQGSPTPLIRNDQSWEGNLIEAPTLWRYGQKYFLFYSANSYDGSRYAMGYAVADAVTGPYTKPLTTPLLSTDLRTGAVLGPGGQDIVVGPHGGVWVLFHSWNPLVTYRRLMLGMLTWKDNAPHITSTVDNPLPVP